MNRYSRLSLICGAILVLLSTLSFAQGLSGTYYIGAAGTKPGGGDPEYTTLKSAVDALNANGVAGPCLFYFTESKTYTEPADIALGCAGTSSTNTITFKPYTGVVATVDFTTATNTVVAGSIDGNFVIGSPTGVNSNLVSTNYLIIDGSNTPDGTSKDLTIQGPAGSVQKSIIRIFGNNDYITIKNCVFINRCLSGSSAAPINVTNYLLPSPATSFSPDYLTIENNTLNSNASNGSVGIHISNSGTATVGITGLVIKNNIIIAKQRGIFVSYTNDGEISGNTFSINSTASQASCGITFQTTFATAGTFNVFNNTFTSLISQNATAGANNGLVAIDIQSTSPKVFNVYNNMISGFGTVAATTNTKLYGIRITSSSTCKIYNNTIHIPEMTNMTAFGTSYIAGIVYGSTSEAGVAAGGSVDIKNNVISCDETSMKVYLIRRCGTTGTFAEDYNNFYYNAANANGNLGLFNTSDVKVLDDWKTASAQSLNSKSVAVNFVSATDLHLTGASVGDLNLTGTPLALVTKDIDGQNRNATAPYMGADEIPGSPLPVELESFTAAYAGGKVTLRWNTATELDNYGFEVERMAAEGQWENIGFVEGYGNSNSPKYYSFADENVAANTEYKYRLKQIDNSGKYEYSSVAAVKIEVVEEYDMMQNYPNPFNPTTVIRFSVPQSSNVKLTVFNSVGEEVANLVDDFREAGVHEVQFNASNLSSGIYFYRLQAGSFIKTMKMQVIK